MPGRDGSRFPRPRSRDGKRHFPAAVRAGPLPEHFQQGLLSFGAPSCPAPLPVRAEKEIDPLQQVGVPVEGVFRFLHGRGKILPKFVHDRPVGLRHALAKPIRGQSEVFVVPQARGRIRMIEHLAAASRRGAGRFPRQPPGSGRPPSRPPARRRRKTTASRREMIAMRGVSWLGFLDLWCRCPADISRRGRDARTTKPGHNYLAAVPSSPGAAGPTQRSATTRKPSDV